MSIYAPAISAHSITAMPSAVYDAIADTEVTYYKVPRGRYTIASAANYFSFARSDLDLDFNGSSIITTPLDYVFYINSVIDAFVDVSSPSRNASHLTGTITAATTTLTMDADEIMDVTPGERVTIVAGVNESDPAEPARFLVAEVLSVAGQVITFTEPLGVNITVYANEAALEAVVTPSMWYKIGPWGEDGSGYYRKGLGTDHGLLRYVGGRSNNITIRNFHLENIIPSDVTMVVGASNFFCVDVDNLTIKNFSCMNVVKSLMHAWRCENLLVDNAKISGEGRSLIFEPTETHNGYAFTAWAGSNLTYRNINISGLNIALANFEVSARDVVFQNLIYNVRFDRSWSYSSDAIALGFYGDITGRFEDCMLTGTGSDTDWGWDAGNICEFENLVFPSVFGAEFTFDRHVIEGTVSVNGVEYGALTLDSETVTVPGSGVYTPRQITLPKGFYRYARLRVTSQGGAVSLADVFGNDYASALTSGIWDNFHATQWYHPHPTGDLATLYFAKQRFNVNVNAIANCTIEFEIQYYPAPDNPGWSVT